MVILTNDFIVKSFYKLKTVKSSESKLEVKLNKPKEKPPLQKLTHLCLNDKSIDTIGDISQAKGLSVLYLHNNNITKLDNLESATCLTHLYLQKNSIEKIENLNHLKKLKKLYLAKNLISVVEGLNENTALEELHIEDQVLNPDKIFSFDPLTLANIAESLRVLNVSGNKLTALRDLWPLKFIEKLDATNNLLTDVYDVCETVKYWNFLKEMDLRMNKVIVQPKYRDKVILYTNKLGILDGKEIKDVTRCFLRSFEMFKEERRHLMEKQKSKKALFSPEITCLTQHLPLSLRPSISKGSDEEMQPRTTNLTLSLSSEINKPAQKSNESLYPTKGFIPRPFRRVSNAENATRQRQKAALQNQQILPKIGDA